MATSNETPGGRLRALWRRLAPLPGGRWIFSRLLGRMVPYSGTVRPSVVHFAPGHVRVEMPDRRRIRNHLRSVHAIALANVGELATGLAVLGAMGDKVRGILVGLDVSYVKKARGRLVAEARCEIPDVTEPMDYAVDAEILDTHGDAVATVRARWRLSPVPGTDRA